MNEELFVTITPKGKLLMALTDQLTQSGRTEDEAFATALKMLKGYDSDMRWSFQQWVRETWWNWRRRE